MAENRGRLAYPDVVERGSYPAYFQMNTHVFNHSQARSWRDFESVGREFESLRAHHLSRGPAVTIAAGIAVIESIRRVATSMLPLSLET